MPEIRNIPKNVQRWLDNPHHPPIPPVEYAGKWIAWDSDHNKILAHGDNMSAALVAAEAAGYSNVILQRVPPVDEILIGAL